MCISFTSGILESLKTGPKGSDLSYMIQRLSFILIYNSEMMIFFQFVMQKGILESSFWAGSLR